MTRIVHNNNYLRKTVSSVLLSNNSISDLGEFNIPTHASLLYPLVSNFYIIVWSFGLALDNIHVKKIRAVRGIVFISYDNFH